MKSFWKVANKSKFIAVVSIELGQLPSPKGESLAVSTCRFTQTLKVLHTARPQSSRLFFFEEMLDDMGRTYGSQARAFQSPEDKPIDQLKKIVNNLSNGVDDHREILTYWNPGELDRMCLPPCMHTHTFSILNETLYLTSYQRSDDIPLGQGFNQVQVAWLLAIMSQITGLRKGKAFHKIINAHIYEDQLEKMVSEQLVREPFPLPNLHISPEIKTLEYLETWVTLDDFELINYKHHPTIKYEFSV